jgi:hypothetical protein
MVNRVTAADFVLLICTEAYGRRFQGREAERQGIGANWEGAVVTQDLYEAESQNTKFIPVVLSINDRSHIPIVLRAATYYAVSSPDGYDELYRRLTSQPLVVPPPVGRFATYRLCPTHPGAHRPATRPR